MTTGFEPRLVISNPDTKANFNSFKNRINKVTDVNGLKSISASFERLFNIGAFTSDGAMKLDCMLMDLEVKLEGECE